MHLKHTPNGTAVEFTPLEVHWILRMIAEWILMGIHHFDSDSPPPLRQIQVFVEHVHVRWAYLIIETATDEDSKAWIRELAENAATAAYAVTAWTDTEQPPNPHAQDLMSLLGADAAKATNWGLAPGVVPVPRFGEFTADWLGNATFEYVRRLNVPGLRNRPECIRAAQWVLAQLPATQNWGDMSREEWHRYRRLLTMADLVLPRGKKGRARTA